MNSKMKLFRAFLGVAVLAAMVTTARGQWDFQFGYTNVFDANALNHVVEQVNIQRVDEGNWPGFDQSYWCPINNGVEARLTQKFTFDRPTASIFLKDSLGSWNFGNGNYGSGSLWASKNGNDWVFLIDAPTPSFDFGTNYNSYLPNSLVGASEIWIQARLNTSGWNILAQYDRSADPSAGNRFELSANLVTVPEPTAALLILVGVALVIKQRANWNQLFFRLKPQ